MYEITVTARIASTLPVRKYPGWRLSKEALEDLARQLKAGRLPMRFDHDPKEPISAKVLEANVVAVDGSHWALEAQFEVDAAAWQRVQARFDDAGVAGGWSFTATVPQSVSAKVPLITLAADAAAWTDVDRAEAGAILDGVASTRIDRLFQYSAVELATVFLILGSVGLNVLGNAAYDAVKHLIIRRNGPTRIEIHRRTSAGGLTNAIITTGDPEIAREAIESLKEQREDPPSVQHFDSKTHVWVHHG